MKFLFHRLFAVLALWVLSSCGTGTPASSGCALNLLSSSNSIKAGETFVLTLQVEGVSDLTAFETHLSFDSALLEVVSIQPGVFVQPDFLIQETFDNTAGTIDFAAAQMDRPAAQGSGVLLKIVFRAHANGMAFIRFRETPAAPSGVILADADGYAIPVTLGDAQINISP